MTPELLKAVDALLTCMERDDYAKCVIDLGDARDAYRAEIMERRIENPWFKADEVYKTMEPHTCPGGEATGLIVCYSLLAWFGYDKDGTDMIGGKP